MRLSLETIAAFALPSLELDEHGLITRSLTAEDRPRVLPPMEIVFQKAGVEHPVYSFEHKLTTTDEVRYDAPALVDDALRLALEEAARGAFTALGCRDVARIDLRLDAHGRVNFIECNPLPGLTPDWSDLCMVARSAGMSYRDLDFPIENCTPHSRGPSEPPLRMV
jgi:D-alanine-D-alanine ligase